MDSVNRLLLEQLQSLLAQDSESRCLLIADESFDTNSLAKLKYPQLHLLSMRFDTHSAALEAGIHSHFADMKLEQSNQHFNHVFFRVSKERLVSHRAINISDKVLLTHAQLHVFGRKDDGIKSYVDKTKKQLGFSGNLKKDGEAYSATLTKLAHTGSKALDDANYPELRLIKELEILGSSYQLFSKPGVFGWKKVDTGSQFLIDTLIQEKDNAKTRLINIDEHSKALDLGCGSGHLSFALHALGFKQLVASDNNSAALLACEQNFTVNKFKQEGFNYQCKAGDAALNIKDEFDFIICNPPFHKGKDHSLDLTAHFAKAISLRLKKTGQAWLVCNSFVGMEKKLQYEGLKVENINNNGSFKVLKAHF
ncbi:class I SAM-dependent methyltransferase [Agaribacterium sp. ZY112]|uniref:class I SAM-dependent methyltransferase n=1 Tax=Agaribacterium sp. ZY112 TaxID=3233574 RepID=UPI0035241A9C